MVSLVLGYRKNIKQLKLSKLGAFHLAFTYLIGCERSGNMNNQILRGQIYLADLEPTIGSEQGGTRPVLILQNNIGNKHSPTTIVAAITSKIFTKHTLPTHYQIFANEGLTQNSIVLLEQIRVIDKARILRYLDSLSEADMLKIDQKLVVSLGINKYYL